jgi:hypothetical protein
MAHDGTPPALPRDLSAFVPMPTGSPGPTCAPGSDCGTEGETKLHSPWVNPQPSPGCDLCAISIDGMVYLDLTNPGFDSIQGITLVLYNHDFSIVKSERIVSPTGTLPYPEIFRTWLSIPSTTVAGELHFWVDGGGRSYALREPLVLY